MNDRIPFGPSTSGSLDDPEFVQVEYAHLRRQDAEIARLTELVKRGRHVAKTAMSMLPEYADLSAIDRFLRDTEDLK